MNGWMSLTLGVGALIGALFLGALVVAVLVVYLMWNRSTRRSIKQVHYDAEKTGGVTQMETQSRGTRQLLSRENEQLRAQMRQMLAQGGGATSATARDTNVGAVQQQSAMAPGAIQQQSAMAPKPLEHKSKVQLGMMLKPKANGVEVEQGSTQYEADWTAPLPENWTALRADDGATFYHNDVTDETSWVHPAEKKPHAHDPTLPEGWEAHRNEDGSVFYFNEAENKCASL